MIEARKNRAAETVFAWMNRRMLRKHFFSHWLRGRHHLDSLDPSIPAIFYANHSSWWDGLLAFHLTHDVLHLDGILMMEEGQLRRYLFFRWIGAFGVNRENREEASESVEYALGEIRMRRRVLWIYPQGILLANDVRPLSFYPGLARMAGRLDRVHLIPVAHRYEFLGEQRPEVFTALGRIQRIEAGSLDAKSLTRVLEENLTSLLNELAADTVARRLDDFQETFQGVRSIHSKYDSWRGMAGKGGLER